MGYFGIPGVNDHTEDIDYKKPIPIDKFLEGRDSTPKELVDLRSQFFAQKGLKKTVSMPFEGGTFYAKPNTSIIDQSDEPIISFYPDNTEYNVANAKNFQDLDALQQIYTTVGGIGAALAGARPQTQNIVMKGGKYEQGIKIPVSPQGMSQAAALSKYLNKGTKPNYNSIVNQVQGLSRFRTVPSAMVTGPFPDWRSQNVPFGQTSSNITDEAYGAAQRTDAQYSSEAPKNEFEQLVLNIEKKDSAIKIKDLPSNMPTPFISAELNEELGPDGNRLEGLTYQEIQSIGRAAKTYELKREYKDAGTLEGYARMQTEVEKVFSDLLGDDFDRDLVRQYMLDVSKHETALKELQKITNDKTGKLWDVSHATALRNLEHSGRMLGNKGLFPAFNYEDTLDQTPLGRPIVKIEREGNRPDPRARGADFQRVLSRVLGKPLSLHESVLYWYDQNMFYFWKEASPLQRQQLVDSGRTRSGGRIKSELTVAENLNQALEAMKFGQETMSGKLGRPLTDEERLKALVDLATSELLKKRKYKPIKRVITGKTVIGPDGKPIKTKSGKELKETQIIQKKSNLKGPRQGNVFYDIDTGETTDYSPDPGIGSSWDIEDPDPDNKYSK